MTVRRDTHVVGDLEVAVLVPHGVFAELVAVVAGEHHHRVRIQALHKTRKVLSLRKMDPSHISQNSQMSLLVDNKASVSPSWPPHLVVQSVPRNRLISKLFSVSVHNAKNVHDSEN